MFLIQILLPSADNTGVLFPKEDFEHLKQELASLFGGVTAYVQAPADGLWKAGAKNPMTRSSSLRPWSKSWTLRAGQRDERELERRFRRSASSFAIWRSESSEPRWFGLALNFNPQNHVRSSNADTLGLVRFKRKALRLRERPSGNVCGFFRSLCERKVLQRVHPGSLSVSTHQAARPTMIRRR